MSTTREQRWARVAMAVRRLTSGELTQLSHNVATYERGGTTFRLRYRVAPDDRVVFEGSPERIESPRTDPMATITAMDALPSQIQELRHTITVIRRENAAAEATAREDAEAELLRLAKELVTRENIAYADAVSRVSDLHPELAAQYRVNAVGRADLASRRSQAEPSDAATVTLSRLAQQRASERGITLRDAAKQVADEHLDVVQQRRLELID